MMPSLSLPLKNPKSQSQDWREFLGVQDGNVERKVDWGKFETKLSFI